MFSNELTPSELELLAILTEECGEVLQIVGKIQRHGYHSSNPLIENAPTNKDLLEKEVGDLLNIISMMFKNDDINEQRTRTHKEHKSVSIRKWLHHQ